MTTAPFFPVVIHHNPQCGTSRGVLAMIREVTCPH
jgi:arsenate reductase-like glutaredoxin family protein